MCFCVYFEHLLFNLQTSDSKLGGATHQLEGLTISKNQFGPISTDNDIAAVSRKK